MRNVLKKIREVYGEVYSSYPVTMIVINAATLVACIYAVLDDFPNMGSGNFVYRLIEWLLLLLIYFGTGCFGTEAFLKSFYDENERTKKTIAFAAFFAIAVVLAFLSTHFLHVGMSVHEGSITAWNLGYFVLILLAVFYSRYKESGFSLERYFVHVLSEMIQIGIAWFILAVGFFLLSLVFEELICDVYGGYTVPQILITGLYVAPCVMMGLTKVREEIGKFIEVLIKYVTLIITIAGAIIIYLYIIKLIFTGIPSNEIFAITSALFFVAIPVGFACTAFDKDSFLQKIAYLLPYIYAPFILLQCYSIITRILEYGLTPSRYSGVVLILLEIIYTVVYAFNRKNLDRVILVMMAFTVVATFVPGFNANALSRISHDRVITKFITSGMPATSEGQKRLAGAYDYLLREYGEGYLDGFLSEELQNQIMDIDKNTEQEEFKSYSLRSDSSFVPTDGYQIIAPFNTGIYSYDSDKDISQMKITIQDQVFGPYDFSEEYESIIQRCIDADTDTIEGQDIVKLDDCELVITNVNIYERAESGMVDEFTVSGYILMN